MATSNATEQHESSVETRPRLAIAAAGAADGGDGGRNSGGPPGKYDDVDSAATKLGISPAALRARCRREAGRTGAAIISPGGGITAFKFGRTWRFIFPRRS